VHRAEVARAITKIARRRLQIDDPHRERLPDAPDGDPREVLDYLRAHSGLNVPTWVLQADVCDALTVINWLWWEDRRRELHFLRAGVRQGMYLAQIGAQVGIGKQGVRDRIDRLEALLRFDRPDEKLIREQRRQHDETQTVDVQERAWLDKHREDLGTLIAGLQAEAEQYRLGDDEREWLDELVIDARDGSYTPATMVMLGLTIAELRTAPEVLALPTSRPRAIHQILERAERLRSDFGAIGARSRR
jgi:hypothetical protein